MCTALRKSLPAQPQADHPLEESPLGRTGLAPGSAQSLPWEQPTESVALRRMLCQIRRCGTCRLLANYSYSSSLLKGGQNSNLINGFNAETIKLAKQYEYTYYTSLSCHSATWKPFRVLPFRPNNVQTPQQSTYVLSGSGSCFFWSTPFPPLLHKHPTCAPARRIYSCPTCRMPVLLLWLFTRSLLSCCVWFPNPI